MAANVTLGEMKTRTRELADMQTSSQSQAFVTDAELVRHLNRGIKQLYQKLIIARGDEYYAKSTTFPTVANQANYALPADFMQLLMLAVTDGNVVVPVPKWTMKQWADLRYLENVTSNDLTLYRYRLVGPNVEVRPTPVTAGYTFTMYYLPAATTLALDSDTFDGVNGWEDYACYNAAIDMLNKEESFEQAQSLLVQKQQLEDQINALAGARDASLPETVGDNMRDWWQPNNLYLRNDWNW